MDNRETQYQTLFPDDASKANAFDKIAQEYYVGNFGRMQKSDFETLLFSIYLEQILNSSKGSPFSHSDYEFSKSLGISQSRVRTLRIKKELQYPRQDFNWQEEFFRISANARYENGKIKVHIPDPNLYLELKNAVEVAGGFVDLSLNGNSLLQVSPKDFFDLLVAVSGEKDRKVLLKKQKEKMEAENKDTKYLEGKPFKELAADFSIMAVGELFKACVPGAGPLIGAVLQHVGDLLIG